MRTSLRHMVSTLRFSRLTVFFLVLQTVLACAFLCNALFFIAHQAAPILAPTGIAADQVLYADHIQASFDYDPKTGDVTGGVKPAELRAMEARLRAIPGVDAVSSDLGMPYVSSTFTAANEFRVEGGAAVQASEYFGDHLLQALGLQLVAGRDFRADEISTFAVGKPAYPPVAIISAAMARRLFPDGDAVGQRIIMGTGKNARDVVVVGVVRHLPTRQPVDAANADAAVLLPAIPDGMPVVAVVVRARPDAREGVARALPAAISQSLHLDASRQPRVHTFEAMRGTYFRPNRSLIWLMLAVTLAVVVVTVIGIMGLTGFWVQRRTRSIGVRRALGATRGDILRYFMIENFMVVGAGVVLGVLTAWGGNLWLMTHLAMPHLPLSYLLIGAVALWILGQLAVLAPALRASHVPPAVATRSV